MKVYTVTVTHPDWDQPEVYNMSTKEAAVRLAESLRFLFAESPDRDGYDVEVIEELPVLSAADIPAILADVKEWWSW